MVCELSYGPDVDDYVYRDFRKQIVTFLKDNFHNGYFHRITFVSTLICQFRYAKNYHQIDIQLRNLMGISRRSKRGFINRFREKLQSPNIFNVSDKDLLTINNSFLLFLVANFIYIVLLDFFNLLYIYMDKIKFISKPISFQLFG